MNRDALGHYLAELLAIDRCQDYCPNGLQVEGRQSIQHIVSGVTACQALLDKAIELEADAVLVHHGYFWKGEPPVVTGMKKRRLQTLLQHELNLFAYHLPLDIHSRLGNNSQLARLMDWPQPEVLTAIEPQGVVMTATLIEPVAADHLALQLEQRLGRQLFCAVHEQQPVTKIAWCTGGGQGFIDAAAAAGCDAFITGEVSEQTIHSAREQHIAFYAAGHHATERYGVQALGEHLAERFGIQHTFVDIDSPA